MTEVGCWRDEAACRDVVTADYDPFFADSAQLQAEAIAICTACPVRDDCLTFAVRTGQQYGIWGGQPQRIVRRLIAADRAGRPQARRAYFARLSLAAVKARQAKRTPGANRPEGGTAA